MLLARKMISNNEGILETALKVKLGLFELATKIGHALFTLNRLEAELLHEAFCFSILLRQSRLKAKGFLVVLLAQSEELVL